MEPAPDQSSNSGFAGGRESINRGERVVAYEFSAWSYDDLQSIRQSLSMQGVDWAVEGNELEIDKVDEALADRIISARTGSDVVSADSNGSSDWHDFTADEMEYDTRDWSQTQGVAVTTALSQARVRWYVDGPVIVVACGDEALVDRIILASTGEAPTRST